MSSLNPSINLLLSRMIICCVEFVLTIDGVDIEDLCGLGLTGDSSLDSDDMFVDANEELSWSSIGLGATVFSGKSSVKMSIMLLMPIKYPSSWLPTVHALLWSITTDSGSSTVFAKSISQMLALVRSWTKRRELPITSCVWKKSEQSSVARIAFNL